MGAGVTQAVLLLVFNRPELTKRVLDAVRTYRPRVFYVAADGPRDRHVADAERCRLTRHVATAVDWPCEVHTRFQSRNLGCRDGVASAVDWFFAHEESGIVLEDDCVPMSSFFPFCDELLDRYRHDTRVMQICGSNIVGERLAIVDSYTFSRFGPVWGWASWRRAWSHYDRHITYWPEARERRTLADVLADDTEVAAREAVYDRLYRGEIDTWDYQWGLAKLLNSGLSIVPRENLISNIGFGDDATHTRGPDPRAALPTHDLSFPLAHPPFVTSSSGYDAAFIDAAGLRRHSAPHALSRFWHQWFK